MEEILDIQTNLEDIRDLLNKSMNKLFDVTGCDRQKDMPPYYSKWVDKMVEAKEQVVSIIGDEKFQTILAEEEKQYDIDCDKADRQSY